MIEIILLLAPGDNNVLLRQSPQLPTSANADPLPSTFSYLCRKNLVFSPVSDRLEGNP